jgi:hypothetical protein
MGHYISKKRLEVDGIVVILGLLDRKTANHEQRSKRAIRQKGGNR